MYLSKRKCCVVFCYILFFVCTLTLLSGLAMIFLQDVPAYAKYLEKLNPEAYLDSKQVTGQETEPSSTNVYLDGVQNEPKLPKEVSTEVGGLLNVIRQPAKLQLKNVDAETLPSEKKENTEEILNSNGISEKNYKIIKQFLESNSVPQISESLLKLNSSVKDFRTNEQYKNIIENLLIPAQKLNLNSKINVQSSQASETTSSDSQNLLNTKPSVTTKIQPTYRIPSNPSSNTHSKTIRPRLKVNKSNLKGDVAAKKDFNSKKKFKSSTLSPEQVLRKLAGGDVTLTAVEKKAFIKSILEDNTRATTVSTITAKNEEKSTATENKSSDSTPSASPTPVMVSQFVGEKVIEKENPFDAFSSVLEIQEPEVLPPNPIKVFEETVLKNPRFNEAKQPIEKSKPIQANSLKIVNLFKELSDDDIEILNKFLESVVKYRRKMTKRNTKESTNKNLEIDDLFKELEKLQAVEESKAKSNEFKDTFYDESEMVEPILVDNLDLITRKRSISSDTTTPSYISTEAPAYNASTTMFLDVQLNPHQVLTSTTEPSTTAIQWKAPIELDFDEVVEDSNSGWMKPEEMDIDGMIENNDNMWDKAIEVDVDGKIEDFDGILEEYKQTTVSTSKKTEQSTSTNNSNSNENESIMDEKVSAPRRVAKHINNAHSFPEIVHQQPNEPIVNPDIFTSLLKTKPLNLNINQPNDFIKKPTWIQKIESETSAERHERVKNDLQKLIEFVNLMSHVDTYLVGRAKSAVKKFAMILNTEDEINEYYDKRKRRHN